MYWKAYLSIGDTTVGIGIKLLLYYCCSFLQYPRDPVVPNLRRYDWTLQTYIRMFPSSPYLRGCGSLRLRITVSLVSRRTRPSKAWRLCWSVHLAVGRSARGAFACNWWIAWGQVAQRRGVALLLPIQ